MTMRVNLKLLAIFVIGAVLLIALWGLFSYTTDEKEAKVTQHSQKTSKVAILMKPQVISPEIQSIPLPLADKVSAWLNRVGRTPKSLAFAGRLLKNEKLLAESIKQFPDSLELRLADYYIEDDTNIPTDPAERKRYESDLLQKVGEVTRLSEGNTVGIWTAVDAFFRIGQPQAALEMLQNSKPSQYDSFGKASVELATDFYSNEGGLTLREAIQKTQDIAIARPRGAASAAIDIARYARNIAQSTTDNSSNPTDKDLVLGYVAQALILTHSAEDSQLSLLEMQSLREQELLLLSGFPKDFSFSKILDRPYEDYKSELKAEHANLSKIQKAQDLILSKGSDDFVIELQSRSIELGQLAALSSLMQTESYKALLTPIH